MRRSSILSLIGILSLLSIYFLVFDPLLADYRWAAFLVYSVIFMAGRFLHLKLQNRSAYLDKRLDAQTSVWTVVGILIVFGVLVGIWA